MPRPLLPEVEAFWTYDARWMRATSHRPDRDGDLELIGRLRAGRFDGAVIFTSRSGLAVQAVLCYLAGIPLRLAFTGESANLLTDSLCLASPSEGSGDELPCFYLDLVATIGARLNNEGQSIRVPGPARKRVERLLESLYITPGVSFVVVHPGERAGLHSGAVSCIAEGTRRILQDFDARVVFTGDDSERALIETIRAQLEFPTCSLAGRLSLADLAALVARARLIVTGAPVAIQIATGVGTPVLGPDALGEYYGSHSPFRRRGVDPITASQAG